MAKELYRRGESKTWHYRFTPPGGGKQLRGSTGTSDRVLAEEYLLKLKNESWRVFKMGEKPSRLWVEAATRWINEKVDHKRSIRDDAHKLGILAEKMNNVPLAEIDGAWIQEVIVDGLLVPRKITKTTINRYLQLIRSILRRAHLKWLWLDVMPPITIPGKEVETRREAWLTVDQFNRLYKTLSPHMAMLAKFAVATGMREGNILRLERWQVELEQSRILIPKEWFKGKRDHFVPLNETAKGVLLEALKISTDPHRVFTYKGGPFDSINLRYWHQNCDKAGLNDELIAAGLLPARKVRRGVEGKGRFVFHGLRHTFATWLGDLGVPKAVIWAAGGWKAETEGSAGAGYQHVGSVEHLLPYVCRLDQLFRGETSLSSTKLARDQRVNSAQTRKSLKSGRPCWARTSDQRIKSPQSFLDLIKKTGT